jgi:hypothetical protein
MGFLVSNRDGRSPTASESSSTPIVVMGYPKTICIHRGSFVSVTSGDSKVKENSGMTSDGCQNLSPPRHTGKPQPASGAREARSQTG